MFNKSKGYKYLLSTFVLIFTSGLSIFFVHHYFGDKTLLISLNFLSLPVMLKLSALLFIYFLLDTLRFFWILRTININVPFLYMIKLAFINIYISNITPSALGGGLAQIYFLNKMKVPLGEATAASTIRTLLPVIFFFIATPFILLSDHPLLSILPGSSYLYIAAIVVILVVLGYGFYRHFRRSAIFKEIRNFINGFRKFMGGRPWDIAISCVLTLLYLLSLFMFPVILVGAMGYDVSSLSVIEMQVIVTLVTYFALTPGATGIAEGSFALIFSSLIAKSDIVTLTLLWRFFTIYIGVFIGLIFFYKEILIPSKTPVIESDGTAGNE